MGKRKEPKTIYYSDMVNDDFAGTHTKAKDLKKNYKWIRKNPLYWFFSNLFYYVIAVPVVFLIGKIFYSYKVVGKKKYRKAHLGLKGCFIYGNHTSVADAYLTPLVMLPRRTYMICARDAVSIPIFGFLTKMLGAYPLPDDPKMTQRFMEGIDFHYRHGSHLLIFPEAHIWKYCTFIRPFPDSSFVYPAQLGATVFGACVTYEERKIMKWRKPRIVLHISDPIYPDMSLPIPERAHQLREAVYDFLVETAASLDNHEAIRYLPAPKTGENITQNQTRSI